MQDENNAMETWRWKMMRKVAEYINKPDDITMSELTALIEGYRNYYSIKELISTSIEQEAS
jgi:hypothetical protein